MNGKEGLEERIGKVKNDLGKRLDDWERVTKDTHIDLVIAEIDMSEAFNSGKADEGKKKRKAQTKDKTKQKNKQQTSMEDETM